MEGSEGAIGELKRVDHLIYVTLKYTRTCDVMRNILDKLISAVDHVIYEALVEFQEKGRIKDFPQAPLSRIDVFKKLIARAKNKKELMEGLELYFLMKKILRAKYTKSCEFRKHVTLTATPGTEVIEVKVPDLYDYYEKIKLFVRTTLEYCYG